MTTRFGAYEILHELKSGGMGSVLLGRKRGPGTFEQVVAIKTIRPEYASTPAVRAMFLDEAAILARTNHPGIATVHDFGEEGGTLYMVMEYVAGNSLRALADASLPPVIAARAIAEAARGLHAAHEARDTRGNLLGLVHRDISPDNLMLGFDGHVKVIDFGIALVKNRQAPVTEFGTVKGKPPYMSPEQVKNEAMDRRSDVFSLAVVLHELLTGQNLFDGDSIYAVARAVEHGPIRPPSHIRGQPLPAGLDAAVMAALERDVEKRTPTAAQLAEDLERVVATTGEETLAAWASRELAAPREAHQRWLASVIAGVDAPPAALGRPTGQVTQLDAAALDGGLGPPQARAPVAAAALPAADPSSPPASPTHLPPDRSGVASSANQLDDSSLDRVPRRSFALPLVLALAVLALGVGAFVVLRGSGTTTPDAAIDAATIAQAPDAAPVPIDAAPVPTDVADPPADATAPPIDAPAKRAPPIDAGARPVPIDAAVKTAALDAAEKPAPSGQGFLDIRHKSGGVYLNVQIDGRAIGVTPIFKRPFPAGTHTLELLAPDTGEVVYRETFELADGQALKLQQK
ncbi:MAG: serine/threonine protein kinase [Myxococcales bacterium]|nr:serine/threonine protein kinase [Myxococcales bacterium]